MSNRKIIKFEYGSGGGLDDLSSFRSREMEGFKVLDVPFDADIHEFLLSNFITDGLPVVPPTLAKVKWMLSGTQDSPDRVLGGIPPSMIECTVRHIAVNAVLAGCAPCHMNVLIAAVDAMLANVFVVVEAFKMFKTHATTKEATPILIINGEKQAMEKMGLVSGIGALGSGQQRQAHACIGRAFKLLMQNCGAAAQGGIKSTTIGGPQFMCVVENHEALRSVSPGWLPFSGVNFSDYVTVHSVSSAADQLIDTNAQPEQIVSFLGSMIANFWSPVNFQLCECIVILSPEHQKMLHEKGGITSKQQLQEALFIASRREFANRLGLMTRLWTQEYGVIISILAELIATVIQTVLKVLGLFTPSLLGGYSAKSVLDLIFAGLILSSLMKSYLLGLLAVFLLFTLGKYKFVDIAIQCMPEICAERDIHIIVAGSTERSFSCVMPGFGSPMHDSKSMMNKCLPKSIPPVPHVGNLAKFFTEESSIYVDPRASSIYEPRCPIS